MKFLGAYLILLCPIISFGQGSVVYDPTADAYLAQSLEQNIQTVQTVQQQVSILQEARNALKTVNNTLRDIVLVDNIIQNQTYVAQYSRQAYNNFSNTKQFTPSELAYILLALTNIVTQSANNLKLANAIFSDGVFKMNDAERLKTLQEISIQSRSDANNMLIMESRINTILQRKYLQKAFGH
jgi:hypothetical protein